MNENDVKLRDELALRITEILLEKGFNNPLRQTNFFEFKNSNPVKLANMMVSGKTLSFDDIQSFVYGEQTNDCSSSPNECCEDTSTSEETPFEQLYQNLTECEVGYNIEPIPSINNVPCGKGDSSIFDSFEPTHVVFHLAAKNEKLADDSYNLDDICFEYIKTTIDAMMPNVKKSN